MLSLSWLDHSSWECGSEHTPEWESSNLSGKDGYHCCQQRHCGWMRYGMCAAGLIRSFVRFVRAQLTGNCGESSILLLAFFVIRDSTATLHVG